MGKKKNSSSLGRSLIRDRFSNRARKNDCMLHTSELNDGYDWGRLNLQSVTEESSFDDFLRTAELAGTEFQAERLNVSFVTPENVPGLLNKADREDFEKTKNENKKFIRIPRRPHWDNETSAEGLKSAERESFLEWRRGLAMLQEEQGLILTPYEKNLDFWRQLWRVVERSDIVVQILDARNPLLFRCEDLENYVKEVDDKKMNFLLLNKSDFLTDSQRSTWAVYFDSIGIKCAFYSAVADLQVIDEEEENKETLSKEENSEENKSCEQEVSKCNQEVPGKWKNSSKLLSVSELVSLFESLLPEGYKCQNKGYTTVGLVGYPNVGKSSTINSIMGQKKVSVSATPGKTKHFQTLFVKDSHVMLCDCPGLVMPSMVATKADMLLSGILPIDQMKDFISPVANLRSLVPTHVFESLYGIMVPPPPPGELECWPHPLLNSFAYCRGFMTQNGQPDCSRASRLILKDFVTGRIVYCTAPPGVDQEEYHPWPEQTKKPPQLTQHATRAILDTKSLTVKDLEKKFFEKMSLAAHTKGTTQAGKACLNPSNPERAEGEGSTNKPWKDHSHKRNKREKLRRVYRHLDE